MFLAAPVLLALRPLAPLASALPLLAAADASSRADDGPACSPGDPFCDAAPVTAEPGDWWCMQGTADGAEVGACRRSLQECADLAAQATDRGVVGASGCTRATTLWCYGSTRAADGGRVSRCFPTATTCAADQDRLRSREGWRDIGACTQSAPSTPESTVAASPPASDDLPEPQDAVPPREREVFDRIGVLAAISTGIGSCPQLWCALIPAAGIGRFELGYRYKWIAPVASLSIGGSPIDLPVSSTAAPNAPGDAEASLRFLDVGLGVQAFPMTRTRFDPFFRLGLAYSRTLLTASNDDVKYEMKLSRAAVVLGGGLSIYVARHFAVGPRFDVVLPFAGKLCEELDGEPVLEDRCPSVRDLVDAANNTIDERAIRKVLPTPWSFTVDARFVF